MDDVTQIHRAPSLATVTRLLESAALPTSDLSESHMQDFFYVGPADAPVGIVGVEFCGSDALLRSLVVSVQSRSHGVGGKLVEHAEAHAREHGARAVYLLTTTAEQFFRSRGYLATRRLDAPTAIQSSPEFASICPASSALLSKRL